MSSQSFDLNEIRCRLEEIGSSQLTSIICNGASSDEFSIPTFKPTYLGKHEKNYKAINAIVEIRAIWKYVIQEAGYVYPKMYSKLTIPISNELKRSLQRHNQAFAVYDKKHKKWLVEPDERTYKYCYNGENFVEFWSAKTHKTGQRLLLVGKYTILQQEQNLLRATDDAPSLFETFVMPTKSLTVGVPGCGKTTYIIKNHGRGSLVLTSCAEGAQDIRQRMADLRGGESSDYKDSYRTIDSYLMNSKKRYSHVWVDEALMEHPGKLFLVCLYSRCRRLYLLGDPNQLGYINRVDAITLRYYKSSMFFKPTIILNTSYRCPVDVISLISNKYDGGAFSASKVLRSLKWKTFTTLKCVPKSKSKDVKYLVFKQAEKKLMEKAKYNVSTVHEFQGKEAKQVVLVRMSHNLQEPLYESAPHVLVAMSRHTESLVYYTPVTDGLKTLIKQKLTYKEIRKVQVKPQGRVSFSFQPKKMIRIKA